MNEHDEYLRLHGLPGDTKWAWIGVGLLMASMLAVVLLIRACA